MPVAVAVLPHDIGVPVRRIAEQNHNIVRWTEFERDGHFAAMEEPDLIIDDLRAAFRDYRKESTVPTVRNRERCRRKDPLPQWTAANR
ncbi:hypothetical protein AB0H00_05755 [Nocardia sp. NPDC023852]|uniref:hypothetical protein n=1 Tax=Nocardia sp. NPDC023852 TaxID=3154697 RepID=UPI0033C31941